MPSPIGHSLLSFSIAIIFDKRNNILNPKFLFFIFLLAVLPDFDLFPILFLGLEKGTKYHQLYTHNFFFAFSIGLLVYLFTKNKKIALLSFIIISLHIVLDSLVTDYKEPIGVLPFYPFWGKTFSYGLIPGISKASFEELFSLGNLRAILIEIVILLISLLLRKGNLKKLLFYDIFSSSKK
jgi:membrane-bound metal-dependent hydrolase YbcI (DUF457 family)